MAPLSGTESEHKPFRQHGQRDWPRPEAPAPLGLWSPGLDSSSCVLVLGYRQPPGWALRGGKTRVVPLLQSEAYALLLPTRVPPPQGPDPWSLQSRSKPRRKPPPRLLQKQNLKRIHVTSGVREEDICAAPLRKGTVTSAGSRLLKSR